MTGLDATLRAKGARLVDQLRRAELPAYTEARGDCDPLDVARLLAFCGDEEACEVTPGEECVWCGWVDEEREDFGGCCANCANADPPWRSDFSRWLARLIDLAAKLPPKRIGRNQCDGCARGYSVVGGVHPGTWDGQLCTADRYPIHDTPSERWLLVVAAEAVARECFLAECGVVRASAQVVPGLDAAARLADRAIALPGIREALDACRAWIAEPTPDRLRTWHRAESPSLPPLAILSGIAEADAPFAGRAVGDALLAAADVLGPDRVREIASRAIREAVRG